MEDNNTSREYLDDLMNPEEKVTEDTGTAAEEFFAASQPEGPAADEASAETPVFAEEEASFADPGYPAQGSVEEEAPASWEEPSAGMPAEEEEEPFFGVPEASGEPEEEPGPKPLSEEQIQVKAYLEEAMAAVDALNADKAVLHDHKEAQKKAERELNGLKNALEKEKNETVTTRRLEVEAGFVKQVRKLEAEVKAVMDRRQKARAQGVKARIEEETASYREIITGLKNNLAELCREKGLPSICSTRNYYTLFCPKGRDEYLKDALLLVIILAVSLLLGFAVSKNVFVHILVPVVVLLICVLVFTYILNNTKGKSSETIAEGRGIVDSIKKNELEIKAITDAINRDENDELYDLKEFDDELARKNNEIDNLNAQKAEALAQFDNVTKQVLTDEIENRYSDKIAAAGEELTRSADVIREYSVKVADGEQKMNSEYIQYIGSRNLTHEHLEKLIGIIGSGEAQSLQDAITRANEK